MIKEILKPLSEDQAKKVLKVIPKNSLYAKLVQVIQTNEELTNKECAALIGLQDKMNEFYQIKHQTKEMIEESLFKQLLVEHISKNAGLKNALLSKFYFGKANHVLGKSYLTKVLDKDKSDSCQGFQLDLMNNLFLDLTDRFSEENFELIKKYEETNHSFHEQTKNFIALSKKLHSLIDPKNVKKDSSTKHLHKDLAEINTMLDKLPMDAAIFKLEYRFAEMYIGRNQLAGDEFLNFYIKMYQKWNDEGFFNEQNQDLKLKSIVNISFLLLSNQKLEKGMEFLEALRYEYLKYRNAFKNTHEIYYVTFLAYYYLSIKDYPKALELMSKFEKRLGKLNIQIQTLYFFYQSYARVLYYNNRIDKSIDVFNEINKADYKPFITIARKVNWSIFEFVCHYQLKNFAYCKNVLQKLRSGMRQTKKNDLKERDINYVIAAVKIFNAVLRNVGYLENLDLIPLEKLREGEVKNPLFNDRIFDLEESLRALKLNKEISKL